MNHHIIVRTNRLNVYFTCLDCITTLQNPEHYPTEWIEKHTDHQDDKPKKFKQLEFVLEKI